MLSAAVPDKRACRNCGEVGHLARACTVAKAPDTRECRSVCITHFNRVVFSLLE